MCSLSPHAPGGTAGPWVTLLVAVVSAVGAAPAAAAWPAGAVVPVDTTVDQFELPPGSWSVGAGEPRPAPTAGAADAGPAPLVAPLPPALATGLVGLGAMALLRAGRRIYRRR